MTLFKTVRYVMSEVDPRKVAPCRAEVAFVGRSNVGKSSLINALLGQPLAKVSQTPGRTRTINVYQVGPAHHVVDLPGYGFARGPEAERLAWRRMIEAFLTHRPSIRNVVLLVDAEVGPTELDVQMAEWLKERGLPFRPVAGKTDKVQPSRAVQRRSEVARALAWPPDLLGWVSAAKGVGVGELRRALSEDLMRLS